MPCNSLALFLLSVPCLYLTRDSGADTADTDSILTVYCTAIVYGHPPYEQTTIRKYVHTYIHAEMMAPAISITILAP